MDLPPIPFFFKTRVADPTNAIIYKAINEVPSESENRSFMCRGSRPLFVNNETDERAMVNGLPAWIMDGSYADQFTFSTMPDIIDNGVIEELPKATLAHIQRQFPLLPKGYVGYTDHTCYWFVPNEPPGAAAAPQSYAAFIAPPPQDEPSGAAEYIPPAPVVVPRAAPRNRNAEVVPTHRLVEKVTTQKYRNAPPPRQSSRGKKPSVGGYRRKSRKRKNKKYNK